MFLASFGTSVRRTKLARLVVAGSLLAALVAMPSTSHAQVAGCTQGPDVCAVDGEVSITFSKTGDPSCVFNTTINWGDGNVEQFPNIQDGQIVTHKYDEPDFYTVQITGSGSSPDPNVTCAFTPGEFTVEFPEGPPPCDANGEPEGCVFVISAIDKHLTEEQKAAYLKSAKDIREKAIPETELTRDTLCVLTKGAKQGKDIVKKGLKEVAKNYPKKEAKKAAKKLLGVPDLCNDPFNWAIERLRKTAAHLDRIANDPPDPDFEEIPVPNPKSVPDLGKDAVSRAAERYGKSLSQVEAHLKAALSALERAQGADNAGADIWALWQTVATAELVRSSSDAMGSTLETATAFSKKAINDVGEQRKALSLLTSPSHKAAISQVLRNAGLSVKKFYSSLMRAKSNIPRRLPPIVGGAFRRTINNGITALRNYGDELYAP